MNQQGLVSVETPTDRAETPRKHWLAVWRSTGSGSAECVAVTADYSLVRAVISGMHTNFVTEDDEHDRVYDPEFIRSVPAVAADLTRQIRQSACREWPEKVKRDDGGDSETKAQSGNDQSNTPA